MFAIARHLQCKTTQDGAVILNNKQGKITILDVMGGYIWRQLEQGLEPEDISHNLLQRTGEDPAVIEADLRSFLQDLKSLELLVETAGVATSQEAK